MDSERERIAHVVHRLGIGANPSLVQELAGACIRSQGMATVATRTHPTAR